MDITNGVRMHNANQMIIGFRKILPEEAHIRFVSGRTGLGASIEDKCVNNIVMMTGQQDAAGLSRAATNAVHDFVIRRLGDLEDLGEVKSLFDLARRRRNVVLLRKYHRNRMRLFRKSSLSVNGTQQFNIGGEQVDHLIEALNDLRQW